jgi:hypothetical protein
VRGSCCLIAPPDMLVRIAEEGAPQQRDAALRTLATSVARRAQRATVGSALRALNVAPAELAFLAPSQRTEITVYDVDNGGDFDLPGERVRGEGDPESDDPAVNEAYESAEKTYEFFLDTSTATASTAPGSRSSPRCTTGSSTTTPPGPAPR